MQERIQSLPFGDKIAALQSSAQDIPKAHRRAWLRGDGYEDHVGDLEGWLHKRSGTAFDEDSGKFTAEAPRVINVPDKPKRGARQRIIAEVAARYGVTESTVSRLWTAYRKFESDIVDED